MKRIHKVKTAVIVKDTIPDEKIEILRDNCNNLRDRAMIDFLLSTGIHDVRGRQLCADRSEAETADRTGTENSGT